MRGTDYHVGFETFEKTASEMRSTSTCGLATLSMIFGILSFLILPFCGALLAVVVGCYSRARIRKRRGRLRGKTRAEIGVTLGILNLIVCFGLAVFWVTADSSPFRSKSMQAKGTQSPQSASSSLMPGVKMANELGHDEYELIQKLGLVGQNEPVICTYVAAGNPLNPEMAVLTTKRISYIKDNRVTSAKLTEINTILDQSNYLEKYQPESVSYYKLSQFSIEITTKDGLRMRVIIRPGLDGPAFFQALNDSWKAAGGGENATKPGRDNEGRSS
jgi:hypothetical protein